MKKKSLKNDLAELKTLISSIGDKTVFNKLKKIDIKKIIEAKTGLRKLEAVKIFKDATGKGLKESKDILDSFFKKSEH